MIKLVSHENKMNIVCYVNKLNDGGAERAMSVLANGLVRMGHDVTLVTDYSENNEYALDDKVNRIILDGQFKVLSRKEKALRTIKRIFRLRYICKNNDADIIISFIRNANFRSILATRFLKTKNLISVRIDPRIGYRKKSVALLAKILYPLANGCVFQTKDAQEWFSGRIQKRSRVIFNPVSDAFYCVKSEPMKEKRIVACGRLDKQKRFDLLIDAFDRVCDVFPEYCLEIYGVGPLNDELHTRILELNKEDRVFLKGRSEDIPNALKDASLFVLASDFEGLPNALMEAMALGLPIVSTDCGGGGARALIEHGVDGLIVQRSNVVALADAIGQILANSEVAKQLGESARTKAKDFCSEEIVYLWEKYISQIVNEG